jgi:S-DNA-T family DNA segregation ATPase FtsK/SpoIIIE
MFRRRGVDVPHRGMTTISTDAHEQHDSAPAAWRLTWLSGPDAGRTSVVRDGRWLIGRAHLADVRCADPALEPFHAEVTLWPHGEVALQQLAGRTPIRRTGAVVELGASSLSIERSEWAPDVPVATSGGMVVRRPRAPDVWNEPAFSVPAVPRAGDHPPPSATVLVTAAIAVVAALAVAVVARQPLFALFAAFGAVAAGASWGVDRLAHHRTVRRAIRRHEAQLVALADAARAQRDRFADHHRRVTGTLATAVEAVRGPDLWARRPAHGDAFTVALGVGCMPWRPALATADGAGPFPGPADSLHLDIDDLAVTLDLGPGTRVAVTGAHAEPLVRSLVVQLATTTGPADWQLVVATDEPARWAWLDDLPHAAGGVRVWDDAALLEASRRPEQWADRHVLIVTDRIHQLALRTGPLRRALAAAADVALVAVDRSGGAVPAICTTVVSTAVDGTARVTTEAADHLPARFRLTGMMSQAATDHVRLLAGRIDPEDPFHAQHALPTNLTLTDLAGGVPSVDALLKRWRAASADAAPATAIGLADDGVVDIDLVRDGPHALIAGTTGSGKSELLRSLVIGLAAAVGPDQLTFVLVDYKGGAAFDCCADLPHVVGVVTDLDDGLADRVLRSLRAELTARERLLRACGAGDLTAMRAARGESVVPRLVVVVDEFAALAAEHPHVLSALVGIAQRGRSLGVHLVLATQRPSGVISDEIRANTNLRLALRLNDAADASDVVADPAPSTFRRNQPGRAALRLGPGEMVVCQSARCGDASQWVGAIRQAASAAGLMDVRRPWCEPLPVVLDRVEPGAVGLVDVPDQQAQRPLLWAPDDGHLLMVGSAGSGVTATLSTLAARGAHERDVLVIDAANDPAWTAVADYSARAGVVRLHERERLLRLLRRATTAGPPVLLVIDGLGALRVELEPIDREAERVLLDRLLTDPPPGCTLLLGTDRAAAVPSSVTALCPNRWLLHVHDRHDAGALDGAAPPAVPGRVSIAAGEWAGCFAQVVIPRPWDEIESVHVAEPLGLLPSQLGPMHEPSTHVDRTLLAVVGMTFDALTAAVLEVADAEHVLVIGPARSGRSAALAALAAAWQQARPSAAVVAVAPRRSPFSASARSLADALDAVDDHRRRGRPTLLVVDDAEMVDDLTGRLTALIDERSPTVLVAAAGRPDALRHAYGHWTTAVRRSRLGIAMAGCTDVDGDLLGIDIPRRMPIAPRPGLAWITGQGGCELVQLSIAEPAAYRGRR